MFVYFINIVFSINTLILKFQRTENFLLIKMLTTQSVRNSVSILNDNILKDILQTGAMFW